MTSEFLPGANNSELAAIGRGLEDVVLPDEAARWECPALGGDLLVQPPELCLRLQQLVACAPVFARLAGEVDIRVKEYFPPLVHVAWCALESHCLPPLLRSGRESVRCWGQHLPAISPAFGGPATRAPNLAAVRRSVAGGATSAGSSKLL